MWFSLRRWLKLQSTSRKTAPVRKAARLRCEQLDERIVPAAGDLDLGFGTAGKVVTGFPHSTSFEAAVGMVVQADGKIVLAGSSFNGRNMDFALARYNVDGTLDTTFGTGGLVSSDFANMDNEASGLVIQSDGKIVVVGTIVFEVEDEGSAYIDYDFELARYNTDGTLDTTFGTGGHVTTHFGSLDDSAFGVAIQSDGKIVATGETNGNVALARYNTNGSLDTSFDTDGLVGTDLGAGDGGRAVAVQSDSKIVVVGYGQGATNRDLAVLRYNTDGSLDTSFNTDGLALADFGDIEFGTGVAIQSDGKIVALGASGGFADNNVAVARLNADGTFDTTFGTGGLVQTDLGANDYGRSVVVQTDGKILVGGTTGPNDDSDRDFALIRYTSTGTLDTSFSGDGKHTTNLSVSDGTGAVRVLSGGQILVAGGSGAYPDLDFTLLRYTSTGTLDTGFSGDGVVTTDFLHNSPLDITGGAQSIAVQPDGKILVAGSTDGKFALVRYEADGTLDTTFGVNGLVATDLGTTLESGRAVILQPDGKIILVGETGTPGIFSSNGDFAVLRYNSDGSLDTTFGGGDGIVTTSITTGLDSARSVALQDDGKIVVGGDAGGGSFIPSGDFAVARYNSNGTLDTTFDTDGIVTTHVGLTVFGVTTDLFSKSVGYSVVVQPDGKILLAGGTGFAFSSFTLLRYNANGSLDNTFDTDGIVTTFMSILSLDGVTIEDLGDSMDVATSMVLQPDGKIVVGGTTVNESGTTMAVLRYNANGSLDTTFSGDGRLPVPGAILPNIVPFTSLGIPESIASVAVQPNGKIVVGGHDLAGAGGSDFAVARFLADGTPDTSFSGDGLLTTDFNNSEDTGYSLALQPDGKILVAGGTFRDGSPDIGVVRYNGDDVTPPDTTITGSPPDPTNNANPTFSFTGSDDQPDGTGVASFEVSFDGGAFAPATSPFSPGTLTTGTYTFEVRAIDNAGNVDPTPATFTFFVDLIEPDTSINSPPASPTSDNTPTFDIQGSDVGSGVVRYEGSLNGGAFAEVPGIYTPAALPDGEYTFLVRSVDAAGNVDSTPASHTFVVDTTGPETSFTGTPTDPTNDATPEFTFTGDDGTGSGVASFEVSVDGGSFTAQTSPFTTGMLSDGTHTVEVRALDNLGNVDPTPAIRTFEVDTQAPTVNIDDPSVTSIAPGGGSVTYLVTYTDANFNASTLAAANITLIKTGTANGTVSVSGSGNTRLVTISNITGLGTLGISIAAGTATDTLGHTAAESGPSATFSVRPAGKFDMKASVSAPAVEGWNKAWQGTKYSASTGYGWSKSSSVGGGTNGVVPSGENQAVMGDYAYGVTTATFQVFVGANQFATVNIYSYGTAAQGKPGVAAKIGNGPTSTLTTNGVLTISGTAGADGILNITFNRATGKAMWIVSAIEVTAGVV